ncbi:MAG: hypothetical protein ACJAVO_002121 [Parvibaculaceae bacterium]|jgi:OOP family OmpA-OmpF porin|nr:hypothetical protein [Parvibaculaceae bacterium]
MTHQTRIIGWLIVAALILLPVLLGYRAGDPVEAKPQTEASVAAHEQFSYALQNAYMGLALVESREMSDWADSHYFTLKALHAERGTPPGPEALQNWALPDGVLADLRHARARLVKALKNGGILTNPQAAAQAQAAFDCWIERQEEDVDPANIELCHSKFEQQLHLLEHPKIANLRR